MYNKDYTSDGNNDVKTIWEGQVASEHESRDAKQESNGIEYLAWLDLLHSTINNRNQVRQGFLQLAGVTPVANCYNESQQHTNAVITIAIRLWSDYDVSHVPASIRREQKMNVSIFRCSCIAVESNACCNFDHIRRSRMGHGIIVSFLYRSGIAIVM